MIGGWWRNGVFIAVEFLCQVAIRSEGVDLIKGFLSEIWSHYNRINACTYLSDTKQDILQDLYGMHTVDSQTNTTNIHISCSAAVQNGLIYEVELLMENEMISCWFTRDGKKNALLRISLFSKKLSKTGIFHWKLILGKNKQKQQKKKQLKFTFQKRMFIQQVDKMHQIAVHAFFLEKRNTFRALKSQNTSSLENEDRSTIWFDTV